ncbi:MAG: CBS domain-containing protein [Acidimicrobiia bacterium]|nr:CBS domain-containing protein [Acidimicrobiia bacterium]MCY4434328.1 CBS domain-containing protein [bacterium]
MMVPEPECLLEDDSLTEAIRKFEKFGYDQFPIVDNEESRRVVGVLTSRYLAVIGAGTLGQQAPLVNVRNIKEPVKAEMLRSKGEVLGVEMIKYFRTNDFVLVVEDGNRLLGIVQLWDIARELWNDLTG